MRKISAILATLVLAAALRAQAPDSLGQLTAPHNYIQKRASSYDRTGGNADAIPIAPGQTVTLLDADGPAEITHVWFTIASPEDFHLKKLVLRIFWDNETTPSVETPIGDFFGLGLGDYLTWQSIPLSVAPDKALNSFFPMPFARHGRITVTNQGAEAVDSFYYNIDYRLYPSPLPAGTLYFHAQYRQQAPNPSWTAAAPKTNFDPEVNARKNLDGKDNYTWLEAKGAGHFVGVTMSVLQNQDYWWGEGDDMFFVDGATTPSVQGTGSEDYFLGAWDFGGHPFSYLTFGAPLVGKEVAGGDRKSVV